MCIFLHSRVMLGFLVFFSSNLVYRLFMSILGFEFIDFFFKFELIDIICEDLMVS